jgi:hypothetical protein
LETLTGKIYLENLDIDGSIILKWISKTGGLEFDSSGLG